MQTEAPPKAHATTLIPVPVPTPCPDGGASALAPPPEPDPLCASGTPEVSFKRDVARLVGCTGEVCHGGWRYDALVGKPSMTCCDRRLLVDPGRPSGSHLVQAIAGTSDCVERMGSLSDAQIALVIAWICQGAADD